MERSTMNRNALNTITNQPNRQQNDLLAKIRPKSNLVQHTTGSDALQISSGLKIVNTRIPLNTDPSYELLIPISDNDHSDEDNFISPIQKLTKTELREELKLFQNHEISHSLLAHDDETGDLEFRTQQSTRHANCCYEYLCSIS